MNKYGEALKLIIKKSGTSKNSLHQEGIIDRNILNTTIRAIDNPGVETIEKYLDAFKATWYDWAEALDEVSAGKSPTMQTSSNRSGTKDGLSRENFKNG